MNHQSHNGHGDRFDVVALVGSAGSHAAILTLLRDLPTEFPLPVIVMQHLPPDSSGAVAMYARDTPFAVAWVTNGAALAPGTLLLCPPRSFVDVLPDATCVVSPCERGALDKPINRFLESVARSFGERAIAVVLTGMGDDGAAGAAQLHLAGGYVLVQHEASAEFAEMPRAAIAAGAANLVVRLADLGQVLGEVARGTPRPMARSELVAIARVFGERGEVAAQAREVDWAKTPLGPVIGWPETLRLIARTALESPAAMAVWWGPELIQIYNDRWCNFLGSRKHPQALGTPARETWAETWPQIGPMVERVLRHGEVAGGENQVFSIDRNGSVEEGFATFSYAPIRDANGAVVGVHATGWDTTRNVVAERRMRALHALAAQAVGASSPREACERAAAALASDPADLPFALLYLLDEGRRQATLAGVAGIEAGSAFAPHILILADQHTVWPLARVLADTSAPHPDDVLLQDLPERFPDLAARLATPNGARPPHTALLLPLRPAADKPAIGVLVAALSPHRPFDDDYRSFLDLVAQQTYAGIAEARARQLERERAERLAELDRAKTEFFANVSHEFRTPLTLLLAPLEDLRRHQDELPAALLEEIEVATSNARRLLRLVNSLLDFSQIDTRRQQADIKPTDLGELTSDIASAFRSTVEAAGLRLRIECDPNLPPVPVDRDMWEKIVSNLLSNAFKFTFEGEIAVELHALSLHAELIVRDTGIGIPAHELPNLFKRFHRVRGARARTVEGAGIGLAIVDDLVKRLGGQLRVRSTENTGTEFTIWLPYKSFRIPSEPAGPAASTETGAFASELARDASRWLADASTLPLDVMEDLLGPLPSNGETPQGKILVVDDNADLREYLQRLLSPRWDVELAADGESALESAIRIRPAIILADVMMPGLDGFALIQRVRENGLLKYTPVILLTARAGEQAAIQGLLAGADDYIAKPFSPRELIARIQAAIERARADAALRESEAKFRSLFESVDEGFAIQEVVTDENGNVTDVIYLEVNRAFEQISGMKDVPGKKASELLPHLEQHWLDTQTHIYKTGKPLRGENYAADLGRWITYHFSRIGGAGSPLIGVVFNDVTERKQREQQQEFLLKFSDALRTEQGADAVANRALEMLIEHLQLDRAYVFVLYPSEDRAVVRAEQRNENLASLVGEVRMSDFPETVRQIEDGTLVFNDIDSDARLSDLNRTSLAAVNLQAFVCASIRKGEGNVLWSLAAASATPRIWTKVEVELIEIAAERMWAAEERAKAEQSLRESEERQAFLVRLGDALRAQTDEETIGEITTRLLGEFLDADRCYLNRVFYEENISIVGPEYRRSDLQPHTGRYRLTDFPESMRQLPIQPMVVADFVNDPGFSDKEKAMLAASQIGALLVTPLRRGEKDASWGALTVASVQPRAWTRDEVALVEGVADRTWTALERARAEQAVRESDERQSFLLQLSDALRAEPNADAVANRAIQMLIEQLQLDRSYITSYYLEEDRADLDYQIGNDSVPPLPDHFVLSDYPEAFNATFEGTLVIEDELERQGLSEAEKRNSGKLGMRAMVAATLRKDENKPLWSMVAISSRPRRWTQGEIALVEEVAERTWAAVERAKAEEALRKNEERQTFLLSLSDAVRHLQNPLDIQNTAMKLLAEKLDVERTGYYMMDVDQDGFTVTARYDRSTIPLPERGRLSTFDPTLIDEYRSGKTVTLCDSETLESESLKEAYRNVGIRSWAVVPLVKEGRLMTAIGIQCAIARDWTDTELQILKDVAERTWDAVERAKAEEALRQSESRLSKELGDTKQLQEVSNQLIHHDDEKKYL